MTERQWYCTAGGNRYGPVAESVLREWITQGRISGQDLVWTDGMPNWIAATAALPDAFAAFASGEPRMLNYAPAHPSGTGGQRPNHEINSIARETLKGKWGLPIAFCLLLGLLSFAISRVPFIGGIAGLILGGPFALGSVIFFLALTRGQKTELGMMFAGFKNFGNALGTYLLMALFVFLWTLLLIVPGIIMSLAYSQAFYLLADNPTMGAMEALRRSKEMMRGHKWRLFCLGMRYFCWGLLCILTLFIGCLWLGPYMRTGFATFYNDLYPPLSTGGQTLVSATPVGVV